MVRYFLENRDALAFDPRHPNAGFRYNNPPDAQAPPGEAPGDPGKGAQP